MAPHRTLRDKKQKNVFYSNTSSGAGPTSPTQETLPLRPALVSQPSEAYEAAQEDEREVLKAIFMDDYEESEATGAWSVSSESRSQLELENQNRASYTQHGLTVP